MGVFPLFLTIDMRLIPIGTAFVVGRFGSFVLSATHNIGEALKQEPGFEQLASRLFEGTIDLKRIYLSVLYQSTDDTGQTQLMLWPIETFSSPCPTDVVIGSLQAAAGIVAPVLKLCFSLPSIGEKLWSVGSSEFKYPDGGIPLSAIQDKSFNWNTDYGHRLFVVEGRVERIFTQRFAAGYLEGPCFAFDSEIRHGMSGGPLFSPNGIVRGVNSAGASSFFNEPKSLGSLLHQILSIQLKYGVQVGPLRINNNCDVMYLVSRGVLATDGSEEKLGYTLDDETGSLVVHPRIWSRDRAFIHDDFGSFQDGKEATTKNGPVYSMVQNKNANNIKTWKKG